MNYEEQESANRLAVNNPQPGDYWHERFSPYFLVVRANGDEITVLSCLGGSNSKNEKRKHEPNAMIQVDDNSWTFDLSKSMTVNRAWLKNAVSYKNTEGFVADVVRNTKTIGIAEEWRVYECARLRKEWEALTGWTAIKESV